MPKSPDRRSTAWGATLSRQAFAGHDRSLVRRSRLAVAATPSVRSRRAVSARPRAGSLTAGGRARTGTVADPLPRSSRTGETGATIAGA